jgi:hypothetical protein
VGGPAVFTSLLGQVSPKVVVEFTCSQVNPHKASPKVAVTAVFLWMEVTVVVWVETSTLVPDELQVVQEEISLCVQEAVHLVVLDVFT